MIKPLRDYILTQPINPGDEERTTKSGIIIADTHLSKVNATQAKVLAIGDKIKDIKVGDVIIFNHRIRIILNDDLGENVVYFFIKEENILGVIK